MYLKLMCLQPQTVVATISAVGFVVCFGVFVCLFVSFPQTMAALQAFCYLEFLFHYQHHSGNVGHGLTHWIRSNLSKIISNFPT